MTAKVEIYTWAACPFCIQAKQLLDSKNINFTEYGIDGDEMARSEMAERAFGRRSLPQIFINDEHIGGVMTFMTWRDKVNWIRCCKLRVQREASIYH